METNRVTARQFVLLTMLRRNDAMSGRGLRKLYISRVRQFWPYSIVRFYMDMSALEDLGFVQHEDKPDWKGVRGGAAERWFLVTDPGKVFVG